VWVRGGRSPTAEDGHGDLGALAGIGESATRQALAYAAANPHPNLAVTLDFARWERLGRAWGRRLKARRKSRPSGPLAPRSGEGWGEGQRRSGREGDAQGASCEGLWHARK